jgi:hypothetical protein
VITAGFAFEIAVGVSVTTVAVDLASLMFKPFVEYAVTVFLQ